MEISSVQIKKKILLEKEDSKQEIRMKKKEGILYDWEGDGLVSNNSTVEFSVK